jgi:hypothetical protein
MAQIIKIGSTNLRYRPAAIRAKLALKAKLSRGGSGRVDLGVGNGRNRRRLGLPGWS